MGCNKEEKEIMHSRGTVIDLNTEVAWLESIRDLHSLPLRSALSARSALLPFLLRTLRFHPLFLPFPLLLLLCFRLFPSFLLLPLLFHLHSIVLPFPTNPFILSIHLWQLLLHRPHSFWYIGGILPSIQSSHITSIQSIHITSSHTIHSI